MNPMTFLTAILIFAAAPVPFALAISLHSAFTELGVLPGLLITIAIWIAPGLFAFLVERGFGYPLEGPSKIRGVLSAAVFGWVQTYKTSKKMLYPPVHQ